MLTNVQTACLFVCFHICPINTVNHRFLFKNCWYIRISTISIDICSSFNLKLFSYCFLSFIQLEPSDIYLTITIGNIHHTTILFSPNKRNANDSSAVFQMLLYGRESRLMNLSIHRLDEKVISFEPFSFREEILAEKIHPLEYIQITVDYESNLTSDKAVSI